MGLDLGANAYITKPFSCPVLLARIRAALLDMIQAEAREVADRTIDVMLSHMRRKLGAWADHIETARGIGYRLVP